MTSNLSFPMRATIVALAFALAPIGGIPGGGPAQAQDSTQDGAQDGAQPAETANDGAVGTDGSPPTLAMEELDADTVIATIAGEDLTLGELIAVRQSLPAQYQQLPPEVLKEGLLEQLINQAVLAHLAREAGIADRADIAYTLRNLESSTLADTYLREAMRERVTTEALLALYREEYTNAAPVEEVQAAHILVPEEEQARAIRAEFEAGTEFAELAKQHGTDGTAPRGGDLGWFVHTDMVPEFADAAFALEVGTVSQPVQSPFGWHLIQLNGRRDRAAPPLEAVQDELAQRLAEAAQAEVLAAAREAVEVALPEKTFPAAALMSDAILTPATAPAAAE